MLTHNKQVSMWGIPLTSSETTARDVVLMKFLRSVELRVPDCYYFLINVVSWRKSFGADSILEQDLGFNELEGVVSFMNGFDREGRPVFYTDYGFLTNNQQMYDRIYGSDENMQKFIRWRVQVFERGIQMLDFKPGGINSLVFVFDAKPDFTKQMLLAEQQFADILFDYYPIMVSYRIVTNDYIPWFDIMFDPVRDILRYIRKRLFLIDQTESLLGKLVTANETNVFQTLYKYISPEYIPIQFGGFSQPGGGDLNNNHPVLEITVKGREKVNIPIQGLEIAVLVTNSPTT